MLPARTAAVTADTSEVISVGSKRFKYDDSSGSVIESPMAVVASEISELLRASRRSCENAALVEKRKGGGREDGT